MSAARAALKAAKTALDSSKFDEAVAQSEKVLVLDPENYHANVFLGLARNKQGKHDEAAKAYNVATQIKPNEPLAWQGLVSLYEKCGKDKVDEYRQAAVRLAEIYMHGDDRIKSQTVIDKFLPFVKENGTRTQYKHALEVLLPSSSVYDFLEGLLPHPSSTYRKIAEIIEAEEKEHTNKEIGERRTRLGAKIDQVTVDVKREVMSQSSLEEIYQNVIEWANEDEVRREFEEKLLRHAYDMLVVLPPDQKANKRKKVEDLARGMVILKHPFNLAWNIVLEWKDAENMAEWDIGILREYVEFFPENGLAKVLKAYLGSEISPFPAVIAPEADKVDTNESHKDDIEEPSLSPGERLLLMTDGIEDVPKSPLAHRLVGEYYLFLEEYEAVVETARKARRLVSAEARKTGLTFQRNMDTIAIILGTSLIHYESPKNHPEAKRLFDDILGRNPVSTQALIGVGLILEEQEEFDDAVDFLNRALVGDPGNVRIRAEAAWCKALGGADAIGQEELEFCLSNIEGTDPRARELKAQTLYRIGICIWDSDSSFKARKDRKGAYARFLGALQANMNFAPAYTSLGIYYADYAKDRKRARKCFQKAFELSPSEVTAAERLARAFADQGDWDLVELVSQRVVDSGKVRPTPGSKRQKGASWPYAALGVVQLNRQDYAKSIMSFQTALRTSPEDYHSWVGLGESYHNSGRYIAATKAFDQAKKLEEKVTQGETGDGWFANYMLANVKRELGEYDEAVQAYKEVLQLRQDEFGVLIALIQTLVEGAWRSIEKGFFSRAAESARDAIAVAQRIVQQRPDALNVWKAVGDACSVFSSVQVRMKEFPDSAVKALLETDVDTEAYELLANVDRVGKDVLSSLRLEDENQDCDLLAKVVHAAILAHKRAIYASAAETHAQAVAWFNLGHSEHRAHVCLHSQGTESSKKSSKYLRAAIRCFKRAIELEAGNNEFWNALGVVTSQLNPKVSQHAFVRSLHINDKNPRVWTNLGTLYVLENDLQLANDAFTRAQSTDPDYAQAWLGQGLLAILLGDPREAHLLFEHASEISNSSSVLAKREYSLSTFDHLLSSHASLDSPSHISNLIQPLFALHQLLRLLPNDLSFRHLSALFLERVGNHSAAIETLKMTCEKVEQDYEVTESPSSLARFTRAKADLARAELAAKDFTTACEDAETALQLSLNDEDEPISSEEITKARLSAHLTAGMAYYYTHNMDSALEMFQAALEESGNAPDVVCLLSQVLWAKGGDTERSVARDQLFESVELHSKHIPSVLLLGAIALLDGDSDTLDAVVSDLHELRVDDTVAALKDVKNQEKIQRLLDSIALLTCSPGQNQNADKKHAEMAQLATSILLAPSSASAWSQLAESSGESYPAEMALKMAARGVPPHGTLEAEDLAKVFAGSRRAADAQTAIMVAPWQTEGWVAFREALL